MTFFENKCEYNPLQSINKIIKININIIIDKKHFFQAES